MEMVTATGAKFMFKKLRTMWKKARAAWALLLVYREQADEFKAIGKKIDEAASKDEAVVLTVEETATLDDLYDAIDAAFEKFQSLSR